MGWLDGAEKGWAEGRRGEREKGNLWSLWVAGFPPLALSNFILLAFILGNAEATLC